MSAIQNSMRKPAYGNDGYDVISDYTTNLEDVLRPVMDYAERLA